MTPDRERYGTRHAYHPTVAAGLADPAWTRLAFAGIVPMCVAATAPLPMWIRALVIAALVPAVAQGWPALIRAQHSRHSSLVIALIGLLAVGTVSFSGDFGLTGLVIAAGLMAAFIAQMLRGEQRPELLHDLSSTMSGILVVACGSAWCAVVPGVAAPSVIVPACVALFTGALLTVLDVRAAELEALTVTVPALTAGVVGGALAMTGFFGQAHTEATPALQSALACVIIGCVCGILMAASNRVLWTHRWVPGGRAAIASAIVPVLAAGAPVYAIARLMGTFVAG